MSSFWGARNTHSSHTFRSRNCTHIHHSRSAGKCSSSNPPHCSSSQAYSTRRAHDKSFHSNSTCCKSSLSLSTSSTCKPHLQAYMICSRRILLMSYCWRILTYYCLRISSHYKNFQMNYKNFQMNCSFSLLMSCNFVHRHLIHRHRYNHRLLSLLSTFSQNRVILHLLIQCNHYRRPIQLSLIHQNLS